MYLLLPLLQSGVLLVKTCSQQNTSCVTPAGCPAHPLFINWLDCSAGLFGSTWHKTRVSWEEVTQDLPPLGWPVGKSVRLFLVLWLVWEDQAYCRWCHPWAGEPGHYQKARRANNDKQVGKQHPSTVPGSVPAWISAMTSLRDLLWLGQANHISFFLPRSLLTMVFISEREQANTAAEFSVVFDFPDSLLPPGSSLSSSDTEVIFVVQGCSAKTHPAHFLAFRNNFLVFKDKTQREAY